MSDLIYVDKNYFIDSNGLLSYHSPDLESVPIAVKIADPEMNPPDAYLPAVSEPAPAPLIATVDSSNGGA